MRREVLTLAAELVRQDQPFVIATVVRREAPSSAQVGDAAVVTVSGEFRGWLGGSCTTPTVAREAARALSDGKPRLVSLSPDPAADRRPGVTALPMTCHSGGTVDIYLEPVLPAAKLAVFGRSPIARAVARIGHAAGFSVFAASEGAEPGEFPGAELGTPANAAGGAVVVATMGEGDEDAVAAALALEPHYVGLVASKKRFGEMRDALARRGVGAAAIARVDCPAGLDIGAKTPEEIAISIVAGIVAKKDVTARKASPTEETRSMPAGMLPSMAPPARPSGNPSIDPICGMTVDVATAKHRAEHGGRTWVFCCSGCREKFLAAPERYAAAAPREAGDRA